ncbi:MAG: hypothetical protein CR996_01480 [Draconibacterium sp.]|nr:MAG: hypothetical protein CR996_01480 [Draconibacterium sp.]PIF05579.1 MAG: hypothetical protein CSA36_06195 [Draconibacterium sp.]
MKNIKLVATDLDGTFLRNDKTVSAGNLEALGKLGEQHIVRVAATGRNMRKVREVLRQDMPFDYIVYSSGAGVVHWESGKQIFNQNLSRKSVRKLFQYFTAGKLNFHAFFPTPDNHKNWFYRGENACEEFERYFRFNNYKAYPLDINNLPDTEMCQFLFIIPEDEALFSRTKADIEKLCGDIRVIRASSPITDDYIWIEIFHRSVSKGNGIKKICDMLNISKENTVGIGNDYNDFDLLEYTRYSFLTQNAPSEIRSAYPNAPSNEEDAFAWTWQQIQNECNV